MTGLPYIFQVLGMTIFLGACSESSFKGSNVSRKGAKTKTGESPKEDNLNPSSIVPIPGTAEFIAGDKDTTAT